MHFIKEDLALFDAPVSQIEDVILQVVQDLTHYSFSHSHLKKPRAWILNSD